MLPLVDGEPAFRRICQAVESARASVWATVAFHEPGFRMPDGRGSLFDVLDAAVARGLDVRVIFWRSPEQEERRPDVHFGGSEAQRRWLARRGTRLLARWDRLPRRLCQHQKSWLVDAGLPGEVAFVGGINLDVASVARPGHAARPEGNVHDVYVEVRGPAATDVHHNFVQRWNESSERDRPDGRWPASGNADLCFPSALSPETGEAQVQITRTVRRDTYRQGAATPGGRAFDIALGEQSVLEQYLAAIEAARSAIYVEDQVIAAPDVIAGLHAALRRGVEVTFLVPGNPHPEFAEARRDARLAALFAPLDALRDHENFTLAGIASDEPTGGYHDIYVHAKILLVDDAWATVGSTNVADRSFKGDTELNASFWHPETVRALRCALLREHLGRDTSHLDERAALRLYREVAVSNRDRRSRGLPLAGLAYSIDPAGYGV